MPRPDLAHKTPSRIEILLQIYHSMAEEFQRDVTFHVFQDLLGYGVDAWDGSIIREIETSPTPTSNQRRVARRTQPWI